MHDYIFDNPEKFDNNLIWAHNLAFDLLGTFGETRILKNFQIIPRGSDIILAKTNINKHERKFELNKFFPELLFYDTMSFYKGALKKIGEIIGSYKKEHPETLGMIPKTDSEWSEMIEYNIQDAKICKVFADMMQLNFNQLGCQIKCTIASTAMDLFKRKYLGARKFYIPKISEIELLHNGYYGGRTEILRRGYNDEKINIYDFNSLYPSVMKDFLYPDPNSKHFNKRIMRNQIKDFEGMTNVKMSCSKLDIPFLPQRKDGKLIFANGTIQGYFTNFEIRKAIEVGYRLHSIYDGFYYTNNIDLFSRYVNDLYTLRLKYQAEKSNMELLPKILLNSLYGKFATRLDNKTEIKYKDRVSYTDLENGAKEYKQSGFYRVKKIFEDGQIPNFINPIISAYVTAYARDRLFDAMTKGLDSDIFYYDTDSLFTTKKLTTSTGLGELKLELQAEEYYLVKPKFYALKIDTDKYRCKIKGCNNINQNFMDFNEILKNKNHSFIKFIKLKEALVRNMQFNEKIEVTKELSLDDDKRDWLGRKFSVKEFQESKALII